MTEYTITADILNQQQSSATRVWQISPMPYGHDTEITSNMVTITGQIPTSTSHGMNYSTNGVYYGLSVETTFTSGAGGTLQITINDIAPYPPTTIKINWLIASNQLISA